MPLLWLSLAFLIGVFLSSLISLPMGIWLILAGIAFGIIVVPRFFGKQPSYVIPFILCAMFYGGARYQSQLPEITPEHIAWYNDGEERMVVVGVLQ